ncbi:MAG: SCP2 sterol-binding domain-containing protein [Nevskiales bacterium]|nr:SCP2 sterol-binding domain-containing protein [Nevskiales bacterium]
MTTPSLLCAALEVALNRYLSLEPEALSECQRLEGRVIALHVQSADWTFFLRPHAGGVQVLDAWTDKPDVRVSASTLQWLRQALNGARGEDAVVSGFQVEGDAELLSRFSRLLARVGFDPEEWLASGLGDVAGPRLYQGLRGFLNWGRASAATLALDTAEYLREETRDWVHRDDVERWMDGVDRLRERSDRVAARLEKLERQEAP